MISIIKRITPVSIKEKINTKRKRRQVKKNYYSDMKKYIRYSFDFGVEKSKRHYETDLIFYYHKLEKGLSLPNPRVGFGRENANHLLSILKKYVKSYGWDETSVISLNTLYAYYNFNKKNNLNISDLYDMLESLKTTVPNELSIKTGGVHEIKKEDIDKRRINFKEFAYSRYSIRNFENSDVSLEIIREAVSIAQKTPSVCNRQSTNVYVFNDNPLKKEILQYQNGNAGFGDGASKILIITSELKDFRGGIERNQSFIDGGMYAMSLIYALHSLGVGTCPLNLCVTNETEMKLKKLAKIGESEVLIMMVAVGNIPERVMVASSSRRNIDKVLSIN